MESVGFIGTGNMAKAIICGILKLEENFKIFCYDKIKNNYEYLKKFNVFLCEDYSEILSNCKYVVLAVKPQNYLEVLKGIKPLIKKGTVLLSIAAGISEDFVFSFLGFEPKFIQIMPNTPLTLGFGAVAVSKGKHVEEFEFNFCKKIFSKSSFVCEVEKEKMNHVIAINGSSPAFIYYFTKGFLNFAKKSEIDEENALKLFCNTLIGSAKMMLQSNKPISKLIEEVTSKKGTTEKGLEVLKENNFLEIIEKTCEETTKRAIELSKENF